MRGEAFGKVLASCTKDLRLEPHFRPWQNTRPLSKQHKLVHDRTIVEIKVVKKGGHPTAHTNGPG